MGREMRSGVRERDHGLFILTENIPNVSRRRRTIVLDKREDRQMGWARRTRREGERGRKGRMKGAPTVRIKSRSGAEFLILLNANREIGLGDDFRGPRAIVPPGPVNICNPFSRANFPLIPILSCQKSTLIPLLSPSPPGPTRPGKTSIGDNAACVRRAHVIPGHAGAQKAQSGFPSKGGLNVSRRLF